MTLRNKVLSEIELVYKKKIKKLFNFKNIFLVKRKSKITALLFIVLFTFYEKQIFSNIVNNKYQVESSNVKWKKNNFGEKSKKDIIWKKIKNNDDIKIKIKEIEKMWGLGTPEDLETFLQFNDNF